MTRTGAGRDYGFPSFVRIADRLVFAWTEAGTPSRVRLRELRLDELAAPHEKTARLPSSASVLLAAGAPAPELHAVTLDGDKVALASLRGKALLVNLWGSGLREFVTAGAIAVALAIGAQQAASGQIEIRALIVVLLLGREIFRPMTELSMLYHEGLNGVSA